MVVTILLSQYARLALFRTLLQVEVAVPGWSNLVEDKKRFCRFKGLDVKSNAAVGRPIKIPK
jgi:hypothetical protein